MFFSISAVLATGAGVVVLIRTTSLKVWHAAVCSLFGFYLAGTKLASPIGHGLASLAGAVRAIKF